MALARNPALPGVALGQHPNAVLRWIEALAAREPDCSPGHASEVNYETTVN